MDSLPKSWIMKPRCPVCEGAGWVKDRKTGKDRPCTLCEKGRKAREKFIQEVG